MTELDADQRRIARAIDAVDTSRCRCELHEGMTLADLRALGGGCTSPQFACPTLDAVRRRVAHGRESQ